MWEFCIQLKKEQTKPADFLFNTLKKQGGEFGAIVTRLEDETSISIIVGCQEYDRARLQIFVVNSIIEVICLYFKQDFLNQNLKLPIKNGMYFKALKQALLNFDKETDCFIISKNLVLEKNINLEAFYFFKLKSLREKWAELASIANDNGYFLVSNENFVDLLKFLVDNLEITHDTINVYLEGGDFKILDGRNKILPMDDDIVSAIIGLSPRQINLYFENLEDEKLSLLCQIFDKRVHFKKTIER